jgi:hypothetical protein
LILICGVSAYGQQAGANSWERLRSLRKGDAIAVIQKDFKEHKGEFTGVSDEAISIREGNAEIGIERAKVLRVVNRASSKRLRNALIGAGIGVAAGATTYYTLGTYLRNESNPGNIQALMWVAPIAAFGGIGAAIPSHPTVYRAPKIEAAQ